MTKIHDLKLNAQNNTSDVVVNVEKAKQQDNEKEKLQHILQSSAALVIAAKMKLVCQ